MTFEVVVADPGRPAFEALTVAIDKAKAGDALVPVTVVVPANDVGLSTRRRLARLGGIAAISFVTPYRLAEVLGAAALAATGRVPVSTPVLLCHVRLALRDAPGIFRRVAGHATTESSLLRAHQVLSDLDAGDLDALATQSPRAASTVEVHRRVRHATAARYFDERDLAESAHATVRSDSDAVAALGEVVLYLPQTVANSHCRLLTAIAERGSITVIAGLTGDADADSSVMRTLGRLGATIPAASAPAPAAPVEIRSYSDPDDEVRSVVRAIVGDVHSGTDLGRIGLFHPTAGPYIRLIRDHLTSAGIEHHGTAVHTLGQSATARFLTGLFDLADDLSRVRLTGWLVTLPIRDGDGYPIAAERWEPITRDAGVVGGLDQWRARLARHRERLHERLGLLEEGARRRVERDLLQVDLLSQFVTGLAARLDEAKGLARWSQISAWAVRQVEHYLGPEPARATSWPEAERDAANEVLDILGRLGSLDPIEPETNIDIFSRTFAVELDAALVPTGRFGQGVMVGPLRSATAADLDVVYVVGMAEGMLPSHPADDPLLPDRERRGLDGSLPLVGDRIGDEYRWLHDAQAAASRRVVLTTPRGDLRRSTRRYPSRWLPDAQVITQASHPAGVDEANPPGSLQEWGMQLVRRYAADPAGDPLASEDPRFALGAAVASSRASDRLTRFDGNLTDHEISSPMDGRVSATRLETWARCPHAYLMTHVLYLSIADDPEDEVAMTALAKGSLFHAAVDRYVSVRLDRPIGRGWDESDLRALLAIGDDLLDDAEADGTAGRPTLAKSGRWRLGSQLREFHRRDSQRLREQTLRPLASELAFGLPHSSYDPVPLELDDGRVLWLRGAIDRIDEGPDGELVVTDYKTGSHRRYADLTKDPELGGAHLQLQVYAHAARVLFDRPDASVHSRYWFTSAKGGWREIGHDFDAERERRFRGAVTGLVAGIEAGLFPHRPEEPQPFRFYVECRWCDPDGLGTLDRWEEAERKGTVAALAPYLPPPGTDDA